MSSFPGERLAVGHAGLPERDQLLVFLRHADGPLELFDRDFQVEFAHPGEDRFLRFLVRVGFQRGVVADEPAQRLADLARVERLGERQGGRDHRLREADRFEGDRAVRIRKRVPGERVGEAHGGDDVAGAGLFEGDPLIAHHPVEAGDPLPLSGGRVGVVLARLEFSGVDANVHEVAVRLGDGLEREGAHRVRRVRLADDGFLRLRVHRLDRRAVERTRQAVHDEVEQLLDAVEHLAAAAVHGRKRIVERPFAERFDNLLFRNVLAFEHGLHDLVRRAGDGVEHLLPPLRRLGEILFGHVRREELAVRLVGQVPRDEFHSDQVDDPFELVVLPGRDRDHARVRVQFRLHLLDAGPEVRTHAVELVDVRDAGDAVLRRLTPHRFALDFDAALGAEHADGPVEDAQRPLDLGREVHVARGVDDIDRHVAPVDRDRGRVDRDPLLALERVEVGRGVAVVDVADFVLGAAVVENALGRGRLARVDVGHDPDVAYFVEHLSSVAAVPRAGALRM